MFDIIKHNRATNCLKINIWFSVCGVHFWCST